ncbi:MAG: type 4a pilus biogenesis protein PilO, partial [Candidatus Acidiferrales bacterium]
DAMALRFNELPWYVQTFIYVLVAVGIFAAGEMLDFSPVKQALNDKAAKEQTYQTLVAEVSRLQAVKQQHEVFRARLQAQEEQLARLRTLVPEEKQTDEFMRLLQASAINTQVAVRRVTSRDPVTKEFYAELPFEVELDGAYYSVLEFYKRIGSTTRIINAGGLKFAGVDAGARSTKYEYAPGTTVGGTCIITTYYTPSEAEVAAAAPPAKGGAKARPAKAAPAKAPAKK